MNTISCYFQLIEQECDNWTVQSMNFGQSLPSGVQTTSYGLMISKQNIDEITKKQLSEIKQDAKNFPQDWGDLSTTLEQIKNVSFIKLFDFNKKAAKQFIHEFAFDILNDIDTKFHTGPSKSSQFILHSIENIQLTETHVIISGQAAISKLG